MKAKKLKITDCTRTTAGVTADGKYSLAVNVVNGVPCLCVHKCEISGGLHYSSMDEESLITAIPYANLRSAVNSIETLVPYVEYINK